MNIFFRALIAATIATSIFSSHTWAEDLNLGDAIKATLKSNPQLMGYQFRARALAGEQQTAALKPPLQLATEVENIVGSGEFAGADAGEFTLALSSVIELGGQREARLGLVSARQQQLDSTQRLLSLDLLTQVTRQFVALAATQEQLLLLQQARQFAQQNNLVLDRQVQAGRSHEVELLRAKAALARMEIDIQKARQQLAGDRIKLSAYWGESQPSFTQVKADLFALPAAVPLDSLLNKLDDNPDLAVLGDQVYVRAAELRQAQADSKPNLEWRAGVRRLQVSDDSALVLGMAMPLGSSGRAAAAVATASAHRSEAEQERHSLHLQLQAQLADLQGAYVQALAEVSALRTQVLPPLKQAMTATTEAFSAGRYSYLELNLAQGELLDAQLSLLNAAARAHLLRADIERLTGAAFSSAPLGNTEARLLP